VAAHAVLSGGDTRITGRTEEGERLGRRVESRRFCKTKRRRRRRKRRRRRSDLHHHEQRAAPKCAAKWRVDITKRAGERAQTLVVVVCSSDVASSNCEKRMMCERLYVEEGRVVIIKKAS
jgi:hypothetical protein